VHDIPWSFALLPVHPPVVAPHLQVSVGILNHHEPYTRPEEEASPKDCWVPVTTAHKKSTFTLIVGVHTWPLHRRHIARFEVQDIAIQNNMMSGQLDVRTT